MRAVRPQKLIDEVVASASDQTLVEQVEEPDIHAVLCGLGCQFR